MHTDVDDVSSLLLVIPKAGSCNVRLQGPVAGLSNLWVEPEIRGCGYGTALFRAAMAAGLAAGKLALSWTVQRKSKGSSADGALRFYARQGATINHADAKDFWMSIPLDFQSQWGINDSVEFAVSQSDRRASLDFAIDAAYSVLRNGKIIINGEERKFIHPRWEVWTSPEGADRMAINQSIGEPIVQSHAVEHARHAGREEKDGETARVRAYAYPDHYHRPTEAV